jgi:hypothetical protein
MRSGKLCLELACGEAAGGTKMNYLTSKMRGWSAVLAVLGTFGLVSTADAILSKKVWDPEYGMALESLGWSGEVTFGIADDCLGTVLKSQWINNFAGSCANKLSIDSATVNLYDLGGVGTPVTLSYGSNSIFSGGNVPITLSMYVDVNKISGEKTLVAVQGGFLFPEFTNASFAKVVDYDAAAYWLSFNASQDNNFSLFSPATPTNGYAFLSSCSFNYGDDPNKTEGYDHYKSSHSDVACSQNDSSAHPAILRAVPEPNGYLLGLASFAVLGVWSRRRRIGAH